jgi:hypothetical protein
MKTISISRPQLRRTAVALALAAIIGGVAAHPARADDDHGRGHDRGRGHEEWHGNGHHDDRGRERDWRRHHRDVYVAPGYAYAPPPVVYAPIPVAPSLNFFFPLRFR